MKVFWWQTGLHIEPENKKEFQALLTLSESLNLVDVGQRVPGCPVANSGNQQSIASVNELL